MHTIISLCIDNSGVVDNSSLGVYYSRRIVNSVGEERFAQTLSVTDWSTIASMSGVNDMYNAFTDLVSQNFEQCFPIVQRKKKKLQVLKPYITHVIKALLKTKHRSQKFYNKWPITYKYEYKGSRNRMNRAVKNAKQQYYCQKLWQNVCNMKNTCIIISVP